MTKLIKLILPRDKGINYIHLGSVCSKTDI